MPKPKHHVFICGQTRPDNHPRGSCGTKNAMGVMQSFVRAVADKQLLGQVAVTQTGCIGPCHVGANVLIYPEGTLYSNISPEDVAEIMDSHIEKGQPVADKLAPAEVW